MTNVGDGAAPAVSRPAMTARLREALDAVDREGLPRVVGLVGPPGSGRTTVVRQLCRDPEVVDRYRSPIAWVALGCPPAAPVHLPWRDSPAAADLTAQVLRAVTAVTGVRRDSADPAQAADDLARIGGLVVVDDIRDAEQAALFQGSRFRGRPRLFITADEALLPRGAVVVRMEPMDRAGSLVLLGRVAPGLDGAVADRLAARAGDRPVLLALAAGIVRLARRRAPDLVQAAEAFPSGGPRPVADAIAALVGLLPPVTRDRFHALGVFPADRDIPVEAAQRLWGAGTDDAHLTCIELVESALLDDYRDDAGVFRLHETARRYVEDRAGVGPHERLLDAYDPGGRAWWDLPDDPPFVADAIASHLAGAGRIDELVGLVSDLRWAHRRLSRAGLPGLAADLAVAAAAPASVPVVAALLRTLRGDRYVFAGPPDPRTLSVLLVNRLEAAPVLRPAVDAYAPHLPSPRLATRWPSPDCEPPALVRRITVEDVESTGVCDLAVAPDGSWIAAASGAWCGPRHVRVLHQETGRVLRAFDTDDAQTITMAPDGTWVALADGSVGDGRIRLCEVATGRSRHELPGHLPAIAPDGRWLATGDGMGVLRVVDAGTGAQRRVIAAHRAPVTALRVSPDGTWLASAGGDGAVRVWEVRTGRRRRAFAVPGVTRLVVAPDGGWLAAAGSGGVHLLDPANGEQRQVSDDDSAVHALVADPDGSWFAAASAWQPVRVWDADGRLLHSLAAHPRGAHLLEVAPDGSWLAAGGYDDHLLWMWDPVTGERRGLHRHPGPVISLAAAPDGAWLITGSGDQVTTWDPGPASAPGVEPGHFSAAGPPVLGADGSWIATAEGRGVVRVWDPETGAELHRLTTRHHGAEVLAAPAADPTWLAVGADEGKVYIWDPTTGRQHRTINAHPDRIVELVAAPDGSWLATTSHEPVVRVWDPATGDLLHTLPDCSGPMLAAPDGSWLATCADRRHAVVIWDLPTGQRRHVWTVGVPPAANPASGYTVDSLALSADGNRLAVTYSMATPEFGWVRDVRTGESCEPGDRPGPGRISTSGRAHSGTTLLRLWDGVPTGARDLVRQEHAGQRIDCLDTSPDGRWLAVLSRRTHDGPDAYGAAHGEIRVYDLHTPRSAAAIRLRAVPTGCRWSVDGSALFAYGMAGLWGFTWIIGDPPPRPGCDPSV